MIPMKCKQEGDDRRRSEETTREIADDKLVARNNYRDKPEVTILKRWEAAQGDSTLRQPGGKEVVRTLVERISEDILRQTSEEKSDFQEGSRTLRTRSKVR